MLGLLAAALVLSIIAYPEQTFEASLKGLKLWWDFVFPALLPFLIVTEMVLGFGLVHGLGVLLEPLMRSFFRLPGAGGWALAAGAIGGYPLGADATAKLRQCGEISPEEAQRLAAVSHLCNPMVMAGVVGAGFLHSQKAGIALAVLHYASAVAAGFLAARVPRRGRVQTGAVPDGAKKTAAAKRSLLSRAAQSMERARLQDGRAFGKLLGDSVTKSIQNLMMVGGFMMLFSVALRLIGLQLGNSAAADWLFRLLPGILEPHLGAFSYSQLPGWSAALQAAAISACLAWSGLSLHAQALGFMKDTGVRYRPFLKFRLLHGLTAAVLTLLAWEPLNALMRSGETVFSPVGASPVPDYLGSWSLRELGAMWGASFTLLALLLACMVVLSSLIRLLEGASGHRRSG